MFSCLGAKWSFVEYWASEKGVCPLLAIRAWLCVGRFLLIPGCLKVREVCSTFYEYAHSQACICVFLNSSIYIDAFTYFDFHERLTLLHCRAWILCLHLCPPAGVVPRPSTGFSHYAPLLSQASQLRPRSCNHSLWGSESGATLEAQVGESYRQPLRFPSSPQAETRASGIAPPCGPHLREQPGGELSVLVHTFRGPRAPGSFAPEVCFCWNSLFQRTLAEIILLTMW